MTRCITPVLLVTGLLGCGLTPSHGPGAIDGEVVDDFAIASDTAGDEEGFDVEYTDDRALTTGTTGSGDAEIVDDFAPGTDTTDPDEESVDDLAALSEWYPM